MPAPSAVIAPTALSIILPAKNEAPALAALLPRLRAAQPQAEIIVVDDGSTDETRELCRQNGVQCLSSPYSMGNGAAVKRGARAATGEILVFMDADGQHDPELIARLLARLDQGYDMVVGARSRDGQASAKQDPTPGLWLWPLPWPTGL